MAITQLKQKAKQLMTMPVIPKTTVEVQEFFEDAMQEKMVQFTWRGEVDKIKEQVTPEEDQKIVAEITLEELKLVMEKMKKNKAPGPDGIPLEAYLVLPDQQLQVIVEVYNQWIGGKCIPAKHKHGITLLFYKHKGEKTDLKNYRPITLTNMVYRIYTTIIQKRMEPVMQKVIPQSQQGFLKRRTIANNILVLREKMWQAKHSKKPLYVMFVDFAKAYDTIHRGMIYDTMWKLGFHKAIWPIVEAAEGMTIKVQVNATTTKTINCKVGVPQGGPLSPYLFNIGLLSLQNLLPQSIWYADDGVIMSDSWQDFQKQVYKLQTWATQCHMTVSVDKSKIMVINPESQVCRQGITLPQGKIKTLEANKPHRYLGVGVAEQMTDATWYHYAMETWTKRVDKWKTRKLSVPAKCVIINVMLIPIFHHVFQICLPPPSIVRKIKHDVQILLGGKVDHKGRMHRQGVGIKTLYRPWQEGVV